MEDSKQNVININEASVEELSSLPGVGESLAERIAAARPFEYLEDLEDVSGIGPNFVERLRPYVDLPMAPIDGAEKEPTMLADETAQDSEAAAPDDGVDVDEKEPTMLAAEPVQDNEGSAPEEDVEVNEDEVEDRQPDSIAEEMEETTADSGETSSASVDGSAEAVEGDLPSEGEEVEAEEQVSPAPAPAGVSRSMLYVLTFIGFFFTLVIAIAFSVGIIASLNNGNLVFASANQASVLAAEIDQLETSIQTLQSDLDSLRVRVDSLEALGDRVDVLETSVEAFQEELTTTTILVEDLDQRVVGIESEMDQVKGSVARFQVFFEGLRELLANVFTPEEINQ